MSGGGEIRFDRRVAAVLIAVLMILTVFAPVGAAGIDKVGPGEHANATVSENVTSTDREPAPIDRTLQSANGTAEVILQFEDVDAATLARSGDEVATLQAHADASQKPIEQYAATTPGVDLERKFWLANAVLVTVDTERVPLEELARLEGVTRIHRNYEVSLPDRPNGTDRTATGADAVDTNASGPGERVGETTATATQTAGDVNTTYGLEQINATEVWEAYGTRGAGTKIAVLDTGVDPSHPDIDLYTENESDPTYPGGWAEIDSNGDPIPGSEPHDSDTHGTHVSGTVAGGNASGEYIGVAPDAKLMHGLVLDGGFGTVTTVIGGMEWAVENDADVISMSLSTGERDAAYIEPIRNAEAAGTVVVSAAGNEYAGTSGSPANVYDGLAVGTTNADAEVARFSSGEEINTSSAWGDAAPDNWPETYTVPDVAAPGNDVKSAVPDGGYDRYRGTSMATPHVAGTVGLMLTAGGNQSPTQVRQALTETAWKPEGNPDGQDNRYGHGIIDSKRATDRVALESGVEGRVTDGSNDPVANATVSFAGRTITTGADGRYRFYAEPGEYTVWARSTSPCRAMTRSTSR